MAEDTPGWWRYRVTIRKIGRDRRERIIMVLTASQQAAEDCALRQVPPAERADWRVLESVREANDGE